MDEKREEPETAGNAVKQTPRQNRLDRQNRAIRPFRRQSPDSFADHSAVAERSTGFAPPLFATPGPQTAPAGRTGRPPRLVGTEPLQRREELRAWDMPANGHGDGVPMTPRPPLEHPLAGGAAAAQTVAALAG
jgi:hypothetical protein